MIFNSFAFSFWIFLKIHIFRIWSRIDKLFTPLSFWRGELYACEVVKVLETKSFGVRSWFGNCGIICHSILGILFSPIRNQNHEFFVLVNSWWKALLVWEFLAQLETNTFRGLFQNARWCVANFFVQNISSSTLCWWVIFFAPYRWWNATSSTNVKDLNSFRDSCAGITKVEICVAWVVHLHWCLLGCAYYLLAFWFGLSYAFKG